MVGFMEVLRSEDAKGLNFGYVVAFISFMLFSLNTSVGILPKIAPKSARNNPKQLWKWRNTANSLIHSFMSGTGAIICFWSIPEIRENLMDVYSYSTLTLVSFSVGYFIYDFVDMASNHRSRSSYELLVHHSLVVVCFGLAMVTRYYAGYALVALLIEVNSVFLHVRQLMIIQGWTKNELAYRVNSYLNLATFIVFRLINLGWLIQWLAVHHQEVSVGVSTLGFTTNSVMMILNIGLFMRIMSKDFPRRPSRSVHDKSKPE